MARAVETLAAPLAELLTMLTYKRPAWSPTEDDFIRRFLAPLGTTPDAFGNHWLTVGESPRVLWSSHTDTVHTTEGKQRVVYGHGIITTDDGECLGADCGAGVWLMVQMIRAKVPGLYVFHRDEESGGKGASWIAAHAADRLQGIDFAIAFDRMGDDEVITHQSGQRTASDAFAESLCALLRPLSYFPSDGGTFTDTAVYADIIPECSNLGVGYMHQHKSKESLDTEHLFALRDAVLAADFTALVCKRDPADYEDQWGSLSLKYDRDHDGYEAPRALSDYVYMNPHVAADFLHSCGFDVAELQKFAREQQAARWGFASDPYADHDDVTGKIPF